MYPAVHAQAYPDKPAVIMGSGDVLTYRQLNDRSNQCAQLFATLGLVKDDAIALFMKNCPEYFYATWGAQRCGLYYTPIATHLSAAETGYIVENCEAQVVVVSYELRDVALSIRHALPGVHTWLIVGGMVAGFDAFEERLDACPATPLPREIEGCVMLYSSGTTGYPKGIRNPNPERAIGDPGPLMQGIMSSFGICAETVYLSPAPLYHAAPIRFCMAMHRVGATAVVMNQFDPEHALRLIERHKVTFSQWVPTMFIRMLKLPAAVRAAYDVSSQRVVTHSAAPCPIEIKQQMIDWWGPILIEYYGATEGHGGTQISSAEWLSHRGSVGRLVYGSVHILDEQAQELPVGEIGTVYFAGGAAFAYHKSYEKTLESRVGNKSTVGDVGYLDAEGFLYLTDRKAQMIISGGTARSSEQPNNDTE